MLKVAALHADFRLPAQCRVEGLRQGIHSCGQMEGGIQGCSTRLMIAEAYSESQQCFEGSEQY